MSHHHSHKHYYDECCSEHEHSCCSRHEEACEEHHSEHCHENFPDQLLEMADQAWMEVLKEKIKAQIIASSGDRLDQLAKIVSDANKTRWMHKLAKHKEVCNFKDKIRSFFSHE